MDVSHRRSSSLGFLPAGAVFAGLGFLLFAGCSPDETLQFGQSGGTTSSSTSSGSGGSGGDGAMGGAGGAGGVVFPGILPVLQVSTKGGASIIEDVKVDASLVVIEDHDGTLQNLATRPHTFEGPIGIEIRGNTSAGFPKKSYGFETRDAAGDDFDAALLGMPAESDWVLHGPYSDKALMRNKLTYDLGRALGRYAPRTRFVELFVNDEYIGVYVFLEKIKRNAKRVDIPSVATSAMTGDISGGYIIKLEAGVADGGWFSAAGTAWQYHYPKFDAISVEQSGYLQNHIDGFESVMFGPKFSDPSNGFQAWIDIPSFVDFAIITELGRNIDGYRKSTYMYKDADINGGLLYMGPLWDFNLAFGNAEYCGGAVIDGFVYTGIDCPDGAAQIPKWWNRLMADPVFTKALRCRWESLRQGELSDASLMKRIDGYREEVKVAEPRDHAAWGNIGVYVWPNAFIGATYEDEVAYMKKWTQDRAAWLDAKLPGTCP